MKSSIIDIPRQHTEEDLFGINVYQNALIKYVQNTDTPITIALQGEWGSGKTSLMNLLRWNLCDANDASYFPIWVNTWQYSLMKSPNQAIIAILQGIINQIGVLDSKNVHWEESKKKIGAIFKKMATVGTKVAAGVVGIDGGVVDDIFAGDGSNPNSDIFRLKEEISRLIAVALYTAPDKKGFLFFIDDLDRIDPPVAVEILELLKNIFDLENCIFILAIDYDVVIKGLKPKFGELTEKNEREFRSFFDKIIQLPFSMPVASYNIDSFLLEALSKIEFFSREELANPSLMEDISEIARLSVGTNPRSLKRLTNTLSLISIINSEMVAQSQQVPRYKTINFALVCIQIAYPFIYNQLVEAPDFKNWDNSIASKLKLRHLTEEEKESLNATEEFDEEWEKITFRMCQKETYLSNRVFQVSGLLNKIATIVNDDSNLGDTIESIIALSAVTNLKAFDTTPKLTKFNRDNSNYKFNSVVYSIKKNLVTDVLLHYISEHPNATKADIHQTFHIKNNMETVFIDEKLYNDYWDNDRKKLGFFKPKDKLVENDFITLSDTRIIVTSNWPLTSQGKPAAFSTFLDVCKKIGYTIIPC